MYRLQLLSAAVAPLMALIMAHGSAQAQGAGSLSGSRDAANAKAPGRVDYSTRYFDDEPYEDQSYHGDDEVVWGTYGIPSWPMERRRYGRERDHRDRWGDHRQHRRPVNPSITIGAGVGSDTSSTGRIGAGVGSDTVVPLRDNREPQWLEDPRRPRR